MKARQVALVSRSRSLEARQRVVMVQRKRRKLVQVSKMVKRESAQRIGIAMMRRGR